MLSRFRKATSDNIVYETQHANFSPTALSTVGNQDKYLKNVSGTLEWIAKNTAYGIVELNSLGLIDNGLLPSYVDDILTYATLSVFPVTGETGKIYIDESNGYSYRWTGSAYYCISTQSFYTKTELDALFNAKLNLSGGTMSGNIVMGNNSLSGVNTITGTNAQFTNIKANDGTTAMTISNTTGDVSFNSKNASGINSLTATTGNLTNLSGVTMNGAIQLGANFIYGLSGAVDVLNLKTTNLRSRDDVIGATLETGGALTLQQNMNANSKNISSVGTLGATTVNTTTLNATTLASFTTQANTGHIYLGSSTFLYGLNGAVDVLNLKGTNMRDRNDTLVATMESGALTLQTGMNANSKNISSIATASGTTANFTNVNPTTLGGCTVDGPLTFTNGRYIYGLDTAVDVLTFKGTNMKARNDQTVLTLQNTGAQLECDLLGNTKNLNNCGKVSCTSLAGSDGTVCATTTSNQFTLSNTMNANSQNITSVNQVNGLTYKGCKVYSTTGTSVVGSNNLAITVDAGFTVVSFYATVDLRGRTNDKFLVTATSVDWTESLGTAGLGMVLRVTAIQD